MRTLSVLPQRDQAALLLTFVEAICAEKDVEQQAGGSGLGALVAAGWAQPSAQPLPFAVAALQIFSSRPSTTTTRSAARAEVWRLTLLETLAPHTSSAARAGLKCEISLNDEGIRILCSGYAQHLPRLIRH